MEVYLEAFHFANTRKYLRSIEEVYRLGGKVSPVQSRRLSRTLRRWRESAGYSVERAAEELLCGSGTISRMETGGSAEPLRVRSALELYGAPPEIITEMVEAAKQRRRRGVLRRPYYDLVSESFAQYLDLEYEASALSSMQSDIVHGLLQTESYARALISAAVGTTISDGDVDRHVLLRMERQKRLTGSDPLALRVILVEAALYTEVGGKEVLREQLRYLLHVPKILPNVDVRVLPFSTGGHPAVGGNFTVLAFPGPQGNVEPEVIYSESIVDFILQDDQLEVARFSAIYEHVWSKSLGPDESVQRIRRAIARLRR